MAKPLPAYRGNDSYVFVSYSHADEGAVFAEIRWLQDQGINVWYDATGIGPGSEWNDEIAKAIKGAEQLLYFITPSSVASEHCRRELNFAQSENRRIVVAHLQETDLPDGLRLSLDNRQAILKHRLSAADYQNALIRALSVGVMDRTNLGRVAPSRSVKWVTGSLTAVAIILLLAIVWWTSEPSSDKDPDPQIAASGMAIGVLPFENMSNDAEQAFFSDGIAEDILNELAKNPRLTVRPRSSSFALRDKGLDAQSMGRRLSVTHILEGSVRRSGNRIRVTAQLSEVGNNRSVWSDRYERELTDVFAVQDAVVEEILTALNVQIGGIGSTRFVPSIEAYDAFLLGRDYFNRNRFDESDRWLEAAVEFDPSFADAWAMLAQNIAWRTASGLNPSSGVHAERRRHFIKTALDLDPSNATALATHALAESLYTKRDYEAAVNSLVDLVVKYPNNTSAHFYLIIAYGVIGRVDLAARVAQRLSTLSPRSMLYQLPLRTMLLETGPLELARRSVEEYATGFEHPLPEIELALMTGDVAALEQVVNERGTYLGAYSIFFTALVPYMKGDHEKAQGIIVPLKNTDSYRPYMTLSRIALIERNLDAAFDYYYRAVREAEPNAIQLIQGRRSWRNVFPEFYADPRYAQMLKDFNVDPESVAKMRLQQLPF